MRDFKKLSQLLTLLLITPSFAESVSHNSCYNDILLPIILHQFENPNSGAWETSANGGYLIRIIADVSGKGDYKLMVTTSINSSKGFHTWKIFDYISDNKLRAYDKTLHFSSGNSFIQSNIFESALLNRSFYHRNMPEGEINLNRTTDTEIHPLYVYEFRYPKIVESKYELTNDETKITINSCIPLHQFVEAVSVFDYLMNPAAQWEKITEWHENENFKFLRPVDASFMQANVGFTPKLALEKIQEIISKKNLLNDKVETHNLPKVGHRKINAQNSLKDSDKLNNLAIFTHWLLVIFSLLVIIGLLLRKKSFKRIF